MKRLASVGSALLALLAVAIATSAGSAAGSSSYRVDAIFDNAKGLIAGQLVKIAGVRVGAVDCLTLTPDYKARIELTLDPRVAAFLADEAGPRPPEGLIADD